MTDRFFAFNGISSDFNYRWFRDRFIGNDFNNSILTISIFHDYYLIKDLQKAYNDLSKKV